MMGNSAVKIVLFVFFLVLLVAVGTGAYYLGATGQTVPVPPAASPLPAGYQRAVKLAQDYPELIEQTSIQQEIRGILKGIGENYWLIEEQGKQIKISQEGKIDKVRYSKVATQSGGIPQEISKEELKVGSKVSLITILDSKTGEIIVPAVLVLE